MMSQTSLHNLPENFIEKLWNLSKPLVYNYIQTDNFITIRVFADYLCNVLHKLMCKHFETFNFHQPINFIAVSF